MPATDASGLAVLHALRRRYALSVALAMLLITGVPVAVLIAFSANVLGDGTVRSLAVAALVVVIMVTAVLAGWLAWQRSARRLSGWLDDGVQRFEDSSFLLLDAAPSSALARLQRQRIQRQLQLQASMLRAILPAPMPKAAYLISVVISIGLWLGFLFGEASSGPERRAATVHIPPQTAPTLPLIEMTVMPPAYTKEPAFVAGAGDVSIADGSDVEFCLVTKGSGAATTAEPQEQLTVQWLDGASRPLSGSHRACTRWNFQFSTGYRVVRAGTSQVAYQGRLLLRSDNPPIVTVRAPKLELQEVDSAQFLLNLDLGISDEYGLASASLHWTLARGGGENVRFTDREQRLQPGGDPKQWLHNQTLRLRTLGMEPGDELYFYLTATDNRKPAGQTTRTRSYIFRHPIENASADTGARLPAEDGKARFRSQRQIILDTETLISEHKQLAPAAFRDRSEKLAQDQMILRLRYGEFLGEESSFEAATDPAHAADHPDATETVSLAKENDHETETAMAPVGIAARSMDVLASFGHAHDEAENATLFDEATKVILRRALQAMWSAESGLRMSTPATALPHEYVSLKAIKELQQADRIYLHKTSFSPAPLADSMRFSGDVAGVRSVQRTHSPVTAAEQQLLREAIAALDVSPDDKPLPEPNMMALRRWLQALLQEKPQEKPQLTQGSRHDSDSQFALDALARLQELSPGCSSCRTALRDQLSARLNPALPAIRSDDDGSASLRWQLQRLGRQEATP